MKNDDRPYVFVESDKTGESEGDGDSKGQEPLKPEFLDIVALTIAAFEILAPVVVALLGVVVLIYLLLRLLAH